jgi:RHS repeat-associated protein
MSYVMLWYRKLSEVYVGTLYDYVARAYDPVLGRFISADTIVPGAGNPQAFNRYSYALNSSLVFKDPSGHSVCRTQEECADEGTTPMDNSRAAVPGVTAPYFTNESPAFVILQDLYDLRGNQDQKLDSWFDTHPGYHPSFDRPASLLGLTNEIMSSYRLWFLNKVANGEETVSVGPIVMLASGVASLGGVYTLRDKLNGVAYVGRSKDLKQRRTQHSLDPVKGKYDFRVEEQVNDKSTQRGIEQRIYDMFQPKLNKIKPISDRNLNKPEYMKAAAEYEALKTEPKK